MALARAIAHSHSQQQNSTQHDTSSPSSGSAWGAAVASVQASADDSASGDLEAWYLWPECVAAWRAWIGVQTQWRSDMAGNIGLDYAGVRADLRDGLGLRGRRLARMWACIKACEAATLEVWAERRKERDRAGRAGGH